LGVKYRTLALVSDPFSFFCTKEFPKCNGGRFSADDAGNHQFLSVALVFINLSGVGDASRWTSRSHAPFPPPHTTAPPPWARQQLQLTAAEQQQLDPLEALLMHLASGGDSATTDDVDSDESDASDGANEVDVWRTR